MHSSESINLDLHALIGRWDQAESSNPDEARLIPFRLMRPLLAHISIASFCQQSFANFYLYTSYEDCNVSGAASPGTIWIAMNQELPWLVARRPQRPCHGREVSEHHAICANR